MFLVFEEYLCKYELDNHNSLATAFDTLGICCICFPPEDLGGKNVKVHPITGHEGPEGE